MPVKEDVEVLAEINKNLVETCEKLNWKNYEIEENLNYQRGNGFLGEFFSTHIRNKDTKKVLNVAIKKAFKNDARRELMNIRIVYLNEIKFYTHVFPVLDKFQREKNIVKSFDAIPKYFYSDATEGKEVILMENISCEGYKMFDKIKLWDEKHVITIFKTYGRFHALSFAYKDQHPKEFEEMVTGLIDIEEIFGNNKAFQDYMVRVTEECFDFCDEDVREYGKTFKDNVLEVYNKCVKYDREYTCLIHGDCWSNNMMFKYKDFLDTEIESMKLIDFQLTTKKSPVHDLSYFFYAGGSKEIFDKLDKYLEIYYESFSQFSRELGSDPTKMLPFEELKADWKEFSKFGILMSLFLTGVKLMDKKDCEDLTDDSNTDFSIEDFSKIKKNEALFESRIKDILRHAYERDLLGL